MTARRTLISATAIPWNAFVVVFLYYTGLTLLAISVGELSGTFMAAAYLMPAAPYAVLLAHRVMRALAAVKIDIGHTPQALLR